MIDGLEPYPAYRDSGLDPLGEVPEDWVVRRAKYVFRPVDHRSTTGDEQLLTVSSKLGVVPRDSAEVAMFKAESYVGHKLCWPGDLVINSLWAWAGGFGFSAHHGIVSTAYGVYRPRFDDPITAGFLNRALRSGAYQREFTIRSRGIWTSRLQLTDGAFLDMPVVLPPADTQAAIVRFLDHADRRIQRYTRAKQRLIELLEEEKQAIIHHAVTQGLDPSVKLKPSGVEWLDHVPEHWDVGQLRRWSRIVDCKHWTVPFVDEGIPVASVREVGSFDLDLSGSNRVTDESYDYLIDGGREPCRGDLIYCRNVNVGACAYVSTDDRFALGQDVCLVRPQRQNGRFLNYVMASPAMKRQLAALSIGSTFSRINVAEVKALTIQVPPRGEQDELVEYLDARLGRFDRARDLAERQASRLREYRTRLISDIVTGKLDVRGAAAELPDDPDVDDSVLDGALVAAG